MRGTTLVGFVVATLSVFAPLAKAADEANLQTQIAAVIDDAIQARFTITSLYHFRGRFPGANEIRSLTDGAEWTQHLQWDGSEIRLTSRPLASGIRLSIYLAPTLVRGNSLDWACRSVGGRGQFPDDCTGVMNEFLARNYPESRPAPAPANAVANASAPTGEQALTELFAESLRLSTWIESYIGGTGKLPGANEIGFPASRSNTVDTIRWNGREVWVVGVEEVLGAELVLVLTPQFEGREEVFWSCRSMGKVAQVPVDCTRLLNQN